jgi:heterodisulfide reductase subunit D
LSSPDTLDLAAALAGLNDFGNAACVGYDLCMKACPVVDPELPIAELNDAADDPTILSPLARQLAIDCVQCGRCTTACPTGAPRDHMVLQLRATMADRPDRYAQYARFRGGHGKQSWLKGLVMSAFAWKSRGVVDPRLRARIDSESYRQAHTLLYFGCYAFSHTGSPTVTLDLADMMGADYEVIGGLRTCCGWPQYLSGDVARAQELIGALGELIDQVQPEVVVSGCAECVAAVALLGRQRGASWESISTVDWIRRNIDKLDLEGSDVALTFHDSCHMTRKMGRGQPAREVAAAVGELREIEEHGDDGLCCGYYNFGLAPDRTAALRARRIEQAKATGAEVMAVECVTCLESYSAPAEERGYRVVELQELVRDAARAKADR